MKTTIQILREKLEQFMHDDAIASDPAQKFTLQKHIEEVRTQIAELETQAPTNPAPLTPLSRAPEITKLQLTDGVFLNRNKEKKLLDAAWADAGRTHIVVLVASSGVGKTSLVKRWLLDNLQPDNWRGAELVYGWTFRKLGTIENPQASEDGFFSSTLSWFGVSDAGASAWERGEKLANTLRQHRALLVLDGIEVLQNPPGREGGALRTPGLQSLLIHLASVGHRGLCVVTSHQAVKDLDEYRRSKERPAAGVVVCDLDHLDKSDGARLLYHLGVRHAGKAHIGKTDHELMEASSEVHGHAFTLQLLGNYLRRGYGGDVRQRHLVKFVSDDESNAFKMLAAWENWLLSGGKDTAPQLAVLRLMSLFSGPADTDCLSALRRPPVIPGLTESIVGMSDADWKTTLSYLYESGLVTVPRDKSGTPDYEKSVDCHPLNREYFGRTLLEQDPKSFQAAHLRLYKHLSRYPARPEPTLKELLPLFEAVVHGCSGGRAQEAYDRIYIGRINRSASGSDAYYACTKLGSFNADYVALSCFFKKPWDSFVPGIDDQTKLELLSHAALLLHGLGRVDEAGKPLECAQELLSARSKKDWRMMAKIASDQAMQAWRAGKMKEAVRASKGAAEFALKSTDKEMRITSHICYAFALFLAGKRTEALSVLRRAEKSGPSVPQSYGWLENYRIFELLVADAERASWLRVLRTSIDKSTLAAAKRAIEVAKQRVNRINPPKRDSKVGGMDHCLYHLILGRLALYTAQCFNGEGARAEKANARKHLDAAERSSGSSGRGVRPVCLESRAWLRQLDGDDEDGARSDLDEAWRIATRGSMTGHMTDILLYRARLFSRITPYPWKRLEADLTAARQLIQDSGYWRRKQELEDAERVIRTRRRKPL